MKNSKLLLRTLLILTIIGVSVGLFVQVKARQGGGVAQYLEERFKQENIPVKKITILSVSPLYLEIIIQGTSDFVTFDDDANLHKVDREVFVVARQHGYLVDRYKRILVNPQGRQLDDLDQSSKFNYMSINTSLSNLPDSIAQKMASDKVNTLIDKYDLHDISIIKMDFSSSEGYQSLSLQLEASSLEDAHKALVLTRQMYPMLKEINAQGAQIVTYQVVIKDKEGKLLLNYYFDLQLMTESWGMADELDKLASGMFPEPAPAPTEPLIESPIASPAPADLPTETITPAP